LRPEIEFEVAGFPPAKSEARSMLGAEHPHAPRVVALLEGARAAITEGAQPFGSKLIGLEVVLSSPGSPPSDATNYLGGIGDVLEEKSRRGAFEHLDGLANVSLYDNDLQIRELHYRHEDASTTKYTVHLWELAVEM